MRDPDRESWRSRQSHQPRTANLDRRGDASLAANFLVILELAVGLDHPAAIFLALLFLGGERLAQPEVRENLRDLIGRSLEQARFTLGELAPREGLHHQHADRLVASILHRHAEESVIALLAGLGKIFVARMTDRVGDADRLALFDDHPDQSLIGAHRDFADRFAIESDSGAQDEPLALRIEQVERADLDLHPLGNRGNDFIEGLAQVRRGLATDRRDIFDQSELVAIGTHDLFCLVLKSCEGSLSHALALKQPTAPTFGGRVG